MKKPTLEQIAEFVFAAQEYIQRSLGILLDETEESLAFVDQYLRNLRKQGLPKTEIVNLIASALSVYFGQVLLSKVDGHWYIPKDADEDSKQDPSQWRIELSEVPLSFSPFGIAIEAMNEEDTVGVDATFRTPAELSDLLQESFSRMAPVAKDYYYSLTGRFETLLYMIEILAELIQVKKAEKKAEKKIKKEG